MNDDASPLVYPYAEPPDFGTTREVAPGVRWLQMPLPMSLKYINLYLLHEEPGWVVVDTGMHGEDTHQLWWEIFEQELEGEPITRVLCTHMHPDHTGQAGFISEHWRAPLYMSFAEYYQARIMGGGMASIFMGRDGLAWQVEEYYTRAGIDLTGMGLPEGQREREAWSPPPEVRPLPPAFVRVGAGDHLELGRHEWEVLIGSGHSPEHVSLYCGELRILLSGDQVLPVITSNVSVQPTEPEGNPLKGFMESAARFKRTLPNDILVLPAHNLPFYGIQERCQQLIEHHEDRMLTLEEFCVTPRIAVDMLPQLFERALDGYSRVMALGECIAHLNHLRQLGRIERRLEGDVYTYLSIDPTLAQRARPGKHLRPPERPLMV